MTGEGDLADLEPVEQFAVIDDQVQPVVDLMDGLGVALAGARVLAGA